MRAKPEEIVSVLREEIQNYDTRGRRDETGTVLEVGDGIATPTLSRARFMTMPFTPVSSSTSSPYTA